MNRATDRIAPWRQANWDARAAANFIGGGTGTGLLIAGAIASAAGAPRRALALVALVLVAIGLGCGRDRLAVARSACSASQTSWMTREAIVAVPPAVLAAPAGRHAYACAGRRLCGATARSGRGHPAYARRGSAARRDRLAGGGGVSALVRPHDALVRPARLRWRAANRARGGVARLPPAAARAGRCHARRAAPLFDGIGNWVTAGVAAAAVVLASDDGGADRCRGGDVAVAAGSRSSRARRGQQIRARPPVRGSGTPGPSAKPGW
jgi:phenylacetyl-CoA:acceptor oxidoreductase subunit 2